MAEEITTSEVVKKSSDGMVKITLEKYQELQEKANEQKVYPTYNQTVIEKTPKMVADEQIVLGNLFLGGGVLWIAAGVYMRVKGLKGLKALDA